MEKNNKLPIGSLYSFILKLSRQYPESPAVIDYDDYGRILQKISYSLLIKKIESYAAFLFSQGLKSGDSFALALRNSSDLLLLSWAAWAIGIITVPLDMKRDGVAEHIYKINLSKAKVLVTKDLELKDSERKLISEKIKIVDFERLVLNSSVKDRAWKEGLGHKALILFTSGTTAHPKGVQLTLENLIINANGIRDWLKIKSSDRFIINLPLHHINSTTFCLSTLLAGGSIAIFSNYSNSRFWERMAISASTFTSIVPSICFDQLSRQKEFYLYKDKLKLNRIQIGSAPVVASDLKAFMDLYKIPLYQGYGQTETALRVTGMPIDLNKKLYQELIEENSIGKPMEWAKVEIMDEKGGILKEKEDGEISVKGKAIMKGYIGTKEGFKNGYFLTGDLGFYKIINGERYFFLKGRKKEIIIKGGINISPVAIENKLKEFFQDIDQVFVIGVADRRYGEEIAAIICWKSEVSEKEKAYVKFFLAKGIPTLSRYEAPKFIAVIDPKNLPTTSTGKVQRSLIKNKISREQLEEVGLAAKTNKNNFILLTEDSLKIKEAFDLYNYCWDPLTLAFGHFRDLIKNSSTILSLDTENKVQGMVTVMRLNVSEEKLSSFTYAKLVGLKGKNITDNNGNALVCISICGPNYIKEPIPHVSRIPNSEEVKNYLSMGKDSVYNFHAKSKGGFDKGAELIKIIPNGRPEDKMAIGYNMLLKYPKIDRNIHLKENASIATQLIEAVMLIAKQLEIENVYAFSRPADAAKHFGKN